MVNGPLVSLSAAMCERSQPSISPLAHEACWICQAWLSEGMAWADEFDVSRWYGSR